jgi:hypothetical protein
MNPSLLSFYPKFLLSEKAGTEKTPKLQIFDTTPYTANGVDDSKVWGVVENAKRGNVSFYQNTDFSDPDVTIDPALNRKIDLPVDANDEVRYGDYTFDYKVRVYDEILGNIQPISALGGASVSFVDLVGAPANTVPQTNALKALLGSNFNLLFAYPSLPITYVTTILTAAFYKFTLNSAPSVAPAVGDTYSNGASIFTVVSISGTTLICSGNLDPEFPFGTLTRVTGSGDAILTYTGYAVRLTCATVNVPSHGTIIGIRYETFYSEEITVPYCKQEWPCQKLTVTGDCIRAVLSANDQTQYSATDTLVRLINLNYPILANGSPVLPAVSTANSSISVGPSIWTGAYAIALTSNLTRETEEGLVLNIILTTYDNYILECDAGLCCMVDCISNLFSQYQIAVSNASAKLPTLTGDMIIINTYIQLYSISIECGDTDKAGQYLDQLKQYMTLIGCDCDCNDCGNNSEPTEVFPLFTEPMPNYIPISYLEANNITIDSNAKVPTNKAVITYVNGLLGNYYTESQIDTLISNYYTKTQIDTAFQDYYTETEVDTILEDYYTETEVNAAFMPINPFVHTNAAAGDLSVTINAKSGIATFTGTLEAEEDNQFTLTNSFISANSMVVAQLIYPDEASGQPCLINSENNPGNTVFRVKNLSSADGTNEAFQIRFIVFN